MKALKWIGIILGGLLGVLIVAGVVLHFVGQSRLNSAPEVASTAVTVPTDAAALERGRHLATISSCRDCHGPNLGGDVFVNESPIGYIPAPNLTGGEGGIGGRYTDADWERAIRHGVAADGRTMVIMPVDHYAHYGDEDLGALIAYIKSIEPQNNDLGPRAIQFPGTIIFGVLAFSDWPVNLVDHASVGGTAPAMGATAEYGEYLVSITSCQSCHAENLAGNYGQLDSPQGPNITPGGDLGSWTAEEFAQTIRTGMTPDGRQLSEEMPWPAYATMSDEEVQALWAYLNSLEPLPNNAGS